MERYLLTFKPTNTSTVLVGDLEAALGQSNLQRSSLPDSSLRKLVFSTRRMFVRAMQDGLMAAETGYWRLERVSRVIEVSL